MTETLCTSGAVKLKAGSDVSTSLTGANYTQLINQAEGYINTLTRYDWVANYSGLNAITKLILEEAASSYAACSAIGYDLGQYSSNTRAQTLININWAKMENAIKQLNEDKNKTFVKNST